MKFLSLTLKRYKENNMLIYVEPYNKLIASQVGTGDNLDAQDIEDGYVDYWISKVWA